MLRRLVALAAVGAALVAAQGAAVAGPAPAVEARAVVVAGPGGRVLHAQRAAQPVPIASITKVMTALVVLERAGLDEVVTVGGPAPTVGEASIRLRAGQRLSVRALLTAMLVKSANDAAYALAYHVGGRSVERFVALMNAKARELGLRETHFVRPDGLDAPGHVSSARDVLRLARVAMRDPRFRRLVRTRRASVAGQRIVTTNDLLLRYRGAIGVKTGHTSDAGWSQVAAARRDGVTVYAVLLGGPSRERRNADLERLLDWGLDQYRRVGVVRPGRVYAEALVPFADEPLELVAAGGAIVLAQVGRPLVERVVATAMVELPVAAGEELGRIEIMDGGRVVASAPLVASRPVEEPSLARRLRWYAGRALDHAADVLGAIVGLVT